MVSVYANLVETVFFLLSGGIVGVVIFMILNMIQLVLSAILSSTVIPAPYAYMLTFAFPNQGAAMIVKMAMSFESTGGLSWSILN